MEAAQIVNDIVPAADGRVSAAVEQLVRVLAVHSGASAATPDVSPTVCWANIPVPVVGVVAPKQSCVAVPSTVL